ncbi:hypothetical protein Tco_1317577 [Tanacetum coccineum]
MQYGPAPDHSVTACAGFDSNHVPITILLPIEAKRVGFAQFLLAPHTTRPSIPPPCGAAVDRHALCVVILGGIIYTRENMVLNLDNAVKDVDTKLHALSTAAATGGGMDGRVVEELEVTMESLQDMSGCADNQKVKYTARSFVGKALTWWNSQIHTRSREAAVGMSWEDFKNLTREEFCLVNEMQKLETKYPCDGGSNGASKNSKGYAEAGTLIDEASRNGSLKKNTEKRGNGGEPSRDRNVKEDNKRYRTGIVLLQLLIQLSRHARFNQHNQGEAVRTKLPYGGAKSHKVTMVLGTCGGAYHAGEQKGMHRPKHHDGYVTGKQSLCYNAI